ncbi:hypothetical protein GE061_017374 [Apolygus lucorum]|uniref:Uncharacterized protein n=1 Tax=Apolygus lucorum TaxID=248454 RepID=A0A8S9XC63_APOLU|nr:hypothetical protein GE061_017374 [Apolygus lucorum]
MSLILCHEDEHKEEYDKDEHKAECDKDEHKEECDKDEHKEECDKDVHKEECDKDERKEEFGVSSRCLVSVRLLSYSVPNLVSEFWNNHCPHVFRIRAGDINNEELKL